MLGEVIISPHFKNKYLTAMSQLLNSSLFVQKLSNSVVDQCSYIWCSLSSLLVHINTKVKNVHYTSALLSLFHRKKREAVITVWCQRVLSKWIAFAHVDRLKVWGFYNLSFIYSVFVHMHKILSSRMMKSPYFNLFYNRKYFNGQELLPSTQATEAASLWCRTQGRCWNITFKNTPIW